jgi:hypothetical protein
MQGKAQQLVIYSTARQRYTEENKLPLRCVYISLINKIQYPLYPLLTAFNTPHTPIHKVYLSCTSCTPLARVHFIVLPHKHGMLLHIHAHYMHATVCTLCLLLLSINTPQQHWSILQFCARFACYHCHPTHCNNTYNNHSLMCIATV